MASNAIPTKGVLSLLRCVEGNMTHCITMYCSRAFSALITVFGIASLVRSDSPQVVDLGYAIYQGNFNSTSNITDFFSIRYAAPPVGKYFIRCLMEINSHYGFCFR